MVTNSGSNGKISTITVRTDDADETGDVDKAISATGYGMFNVMLFLAALPVAWTGIFDTTTTAFIIASAECDLRLTFFDKGVLCGFPFLGMALTSFLWDHLTPHVGMRNLFIFGLLVDCILNLLASAIDSYYGFLVIKFFNGVLTSLRYIHSKSTNFSAGGPFSMVATYLSEFHSPSYKASFTRWGNLAINVAIIIPAVLAFLITPLPLTVNVFNQRYTAWRIYLLVCSIVPVLGLVTASMLPQSPKFLVENGKLDEALTLLKKMYSVNRRKPADTFPIKTLLVWPSSQGSVFKTNSEKIRLAYYNTKLLFSSPYLRAFMFLNFLQFGSMLGFNTMRLWVPHLFTILNNFDYERWTEDRAPTIREMLDRRMSVPARDYLDYPDFNNICITWKIKAVVYQNSSIIAVSAVVFSFLAAMVYTSKFRKKIIMLAAFFISVISSFGINWAQSTPYMLTLAAAIIVTTRITGNIVTAMNIDVIPIPLRSTSLNVLITVGNIAAVLGNFIFSALLDVECLVGFMGIGCLLLVCFCLSFFHPRPVKMLEKNHSMSNA